MFSRHEVLKTVEVRVVSGCEQDIVRGKSRVLKGVGGDTMSRIGVR